jgi:exopolyphosphatase/guanosine-5'-triphosphate,3'-diphosphate pyrophosphatase
MVDIGGGSVELVLAAGSVIDRIYSLPLGAVRLTEQHIKSDPISDKNWRKLQKEIERLITKRVGKPPFKVKTMIGSGGTFTTLAEVAEAEREGDQGSVHGYRLDTTKAGEILDRLRRASLEERQQMPGLNPDRADIIVAGIASVLGLANRLGCRVIRINEGGVREGLLLSMIKERLRGRAAKKVDVADRMDWVRKFASKCHSNEAHCDHVAKLALMIFDGLEDHYDLPEAGRDVLQAAAILHDIGYMISHAKHHKHAYHLIMHGDLPAFSAREVELIANVARYHRRAYPKKRHENFVRLKKVDRRLVRDLSAILRVADGLDRTFNQAVTSVQVNVDDDVIRMIVDAGVPPQVELWDAHRKAGLFESVYGTPLELEWAGVRERTLKAVS